MLTAKSVFRDRLDAMAPSIHSQGAAAPWPAYSAYVKALGSYTATGRIALNIDLVRAGPCY